MVEPETFQYLHVSFQRLASNSASESGNSCHELMFDAGRALREAVGRGLFHPPQQMGWLSSNPEGPAGSGNEWGCWWDAYWWDAVLAFASDEDTAVVIVEPRLQRRCRGKRLWYPFWYIFENEMMPEAGSPSLERSLLRCVASASADACRHLATTCMSQAAADAGAIRDVRVLPTRSPQEQKPQHIIVDPGRFEVRFGQVVCRIGPRNPFRLINRLAETPGVHVENEDLANAIWGNGRHAGRLANTVARLKARLNSCGLQAVSALIKGASGHYYLDMTEDDIEIV